MQVPPQIVRLFLEIQRSAVIVTAVRVIIGYSERFLPFPYTENIRVL